LHPTAYYKPVKDHYLAQAAKVSIEELRELQEQLHQNLKFISYKIAHYYNKHRSTEPILQEGDTTYLLRRHIKTRQPSLKLDHIKLGPFKITKRIGKLNYQLDLPARYKIHPIFHISILEPTPKEIPTNSN
jgi:hypothetical protein